MIYDGRRDSSVAPAGVRFGISSEDAPADFDCGGRVDLEPGEPVFAQSHHFPTGHCPRCERGERPTVLVASAEEVEQFVNDRDRVDAGGADERFRK